MSAEEYFPKIKAMLKKHFGYKGEISLSFTIQSLKPVSDEINTFFDDFGNTFNIDGNEYNYYDYFCEDVHPFYAMKNMFKHVFNPSKHKKTDITIAHLVEVIEKGKWFKPNEK